ncbi:unnamed protein product [Closterium sp. Yama58-4]|nr:unnamed protein product [Closterium sp. Yama58-4]
MCFPDNMAAANTGVRTFPWIPPANSQSRSVTNTANAPTVRKFRAKRFAKLPRKGSNELTDSLLLTAWLATVAPATSDRPSILSDASLLSPYATVNYFAFGSNLNLDLLQRRSTGVNAPVAEFLGSPVAGILGSAVAEEDPVLAEPAVVYHHRLAFNVRVLPPFEPAVAAIEPVGETRAAVAGNRRDRVAMTRPAVARNGLDRAAGTRTAVAGSEQALAQSRAAVAEAGSAVARNGAAVAGMEGREASPSVHGLVVQMRRIDYERLMWSEGISRNEQRPYIEHLVTAHTYSGSTVQALTLRANPKSPSFLPPHKELPPSARYRGLLLKGARRAGLRREYVEEMRRVMDGNRLDGWWQWW